jgi:N-acetylglutamate synthase-like GNAT family acetyltransferase
MEPWTLRPARPEDMEWVVRRHRELYTEEYGWGEAFAGLVADSAAAIARDLGSGPAAGWIAEHDGQPAGCVFLTRDADQVARLRLLIVDPRARGQGIGRRLVRECIASARQAGCRKISLWTNHVLATARRIYAAEGFRVVATEVHDSFGVPLTAETWELEL